MVEFNKNSLLIVSIVAIVGIVAIVLGTFGMNKAPNFGANGVTALDLAGSASDQLLKRYITQENISIRFRNIFVICDKVTGKLMLLQYLGADKFAGETPSLYFKDLKYGNIIQQVYWEAPSLTMIGPKGAVGKLATLKTGGFDYAVFNVSSIKVNNFPILIDLNANGQIRSGESCIT